MTKGECVSVLQSLCLPDEHHEAVWDIDLQAWLEKGFKTIVLDVDNTVVSRKQKTLSLQHLNWVQKCKDMGFQVLILSNNRSRKRIEKICKQVDCKGYYGAMKPLAFSFRQLAEQFEFSFETCVMVGDQVLTDVLVGNWVRAHSVLVEPIDETLSTLKRLQYGFERWLKRRLDQG